MMKSKTICFAVLTVFFIVAGYICLSGFTGKEYASPSEFSTTAGYSSLSPDTLPKDLKYKSYDTLPFRYKKLTPKDSSLSLLKRIGNIFKFRKSARFNENNRVIALLNDLHIGDSIVATQQNVAFLNKYLTDTVNQNIDSLYSLVNFLQSKTSRQYTDIFEDIEDMEKRMAMLDEYNKIGKDRFAKRIVSDKDLNILASKIFPIISVSSDIKELTEKMALISTLKNIRDSVNIVRKVTEPDGNKKLYRVGTKNKIEVYGFYDYFPKSRVEAANLIFITTLVYNNLYIHSTTGDIKDLNGWDTATIISQAQNAGCSIGPTFAIATEENVKVFLTNPNAQANFITTAIYLMKFRNASAINISFSNFLPADTDIKYSIKFTSFIKKLGDKLKREDTSYKLLLTVPAITAGNYYPLNQLAGITDRVIIDFSTNYSTVASPLASMTALKEVIHFFIRANIPPGKIVVSLPYHGTKWARVPFYPEEFIEYISYATLRNNYKFPAYINYLDEKSVTSVMDSISFRKDTVRRIFYDDEVTLGLKYKYILESAFKGVAVNALGEDQGYTGLWDEMAYAFARPDTVVISGMPKRRLVKEQGLGLFERLYRRLTLYNYILQNPCEICFENIKDSAKNEQMRQYLLDLDICAKMKAENLERMKNGKVPYRSQFQFVNSMLISTVFVITVILIIILLALGLIYFFKIKAHGDNWSKKKLVTRLLLADSVLIVIFLFTLLFCNDNIMFFGSSASDKPGFSKDYAADNTAPCIASATTFDYCVKDPESDCINMPLQTLLGIIILGLIVGGILTRFLILPLIKRYEKP